MDSMDHVRERFAPLEQQTEPLKHQTQALQAQTRPGERRRGWPLAWLGAAVAALGLALACPFTGQAKTFRCRAGDVPCLIAAINEANANGQENTIRLAAGTYTLTTSDTPGNGLPVIMSHLTILGAGAATTIIERDPSAPGFGLLAVAATGTATLKRLTLRGGSSFGGGGIRNSGTLSLIACIVTGNSAGLSVGGGIRNGGTLSLMKCLVSENNADFGGGLFNDDGIVTIANTTFVDNGAGFCCGGGLHNDRGTITIANSTFVSNSAFLGGGLANGGTVAIINTTFAQNVAFRGGGLDSTGLAILQSTTFAENGAFDGGGISSSGSVVLQNTILARNTGATTAPDCSGQFISLGNNLIGDTTGCTITLGPHDLTGDPGLGDFRDNGRPGNGHFPLLSTSQAIDAGNNAVCPRADQLGRLRIGPCDIGAITFRDRDDRQHEEDDQHDKEHDDTGPVAAAQAAP